MSQEAFLCARARKISIIEGSFWSVMDGFGLRYAIPFALAVSSGSLVIGFVSSFPPLISAFLALYTLKTMKVLSRRHLIMLCAALQTFMWPLMILCGFLYQNQHIAPASAVFMFTAVYTVICITGGILYPAWNSWMSDIVPDKRGVYFARRNIICGTVALLSMLFAGKTLDFFKAGGQLFTGFFLLFSIAFSARAVSTLLFLIKYEPEYTSHDHQQFSFWQFVSDLPKDNFGRFTLLQSFFSLASSVASPFFPVFLLRDLSLSYSSYTAILFSFSLSNILFMNFWGKFIDKKGSLLTVRICGLLICVIPLLWLMSTVFHSGLYLVLFLMAAEGLNGMLNAGFGIASGNYLYEAAPGKVALYTAYMSIPVALGTFAGAMSGAFIEHSSFTVTGYSLASVFLLSSILRILSYLMLIPKIRELRINSDSQAV